MASALGRLLQTLALTAPAGRERAQQLASRAIEVRPYCVLAREGRAA